MARVEPLLACHYAQYLTYFASCLLQGEGEEEAAPVLLVAEKYETYEYAVLEKQPETVMLSSAPEIMEKAGCSAPEREDLEPEECHKMSSAVEVEYELKPVVLSKAIEQDALAYDTVEMSKDMSTAVECQPELEVVHHEKISPRTGDVKVDSEGEKVSFIFNFILSNMVPFYQL